MSNQFHCLKKQWSAAVAVLVLGAGWASSAQAIGFKLADGAIDGQFDTTISWGMSMRTQARNLENSRPSSAGLARFTQPGAGMYGDRVYDEKYDIVINRLKASHDLELTGDGWGTFVRGNYFYDERADNGPELTHSARNKAVNHGDLTDAYVWWRMGPDDQLVVRLGKQVISWGENTFIGWAINDINTVDISQLRVPGVELKDALIGTPALNLSWQATDTISFDAFTLFTYDEVKLDAVGGFFLTNDIFGDNMSGYPSRDPITGLTATPAGTLTPFGPAFLPFAGAPICTAPDGGALGFQGICQTGDDIPSGWGQWGVAMHYYAAGLGNGVEFGFYYQSLIDHVFRLGGTAGNIAPFGGPGVNPAGQAAGVGRYYRDFNQPAVERWGWSWNTTVGPWAWGGEYSYRRNDMLQEAPANTFAWTVLASNPSPRTALGPGLVPTLTALGLPAVGVAPGTKGDFLEDFGHHQLQMTFQRLWGPMPIFAGADQWNTIFEVVHGWVSGMPDREAFARFDETLTNNWQGLVARSTHTYNNALFNRANLDFNLALKWDIRGQSPEFGGTKQFIEDRKQASVGFAFDFRQRWKGGINHTWFWGAGSEVYKDDQTGLRNLRSKDSSRDRDFLSFDLAYSF